MLEQVFRPGRIGRLELPHRIVTGAMHLGIESEPGGEALAAFYAERAHGGAGLIVTGGSAISRVGAGGRHYSFINQPEEAPKLRRVADAVHEDGGCIALQLFHAGRYASERDFGLQPIAPSAVPSRFSRTTPRAMTGVDIAGVIGEFARGARCARELGFDAVEIMGSEGYLLNQFLSPLTNQREDEWGGDFERRARFARAVLRAIRAAVGADFPVLYRISGADLMPGSTTDEETCAFARMLADDGVDALDVGLGWHESSIPTVQLTVTPGAWVPYAEQIKAAVGSLPVIASTRINTIELAARVLGGGSGKGGKGGKGAPEPVDFVSMARPFLADSQLIAKARAGRAREINLCIACNQACIDPSLRDQPVSCMVNPRAGRELVLREERARRRARSFAVVGGGPAGLEAARVLAALGHRVVLYEAAAALGGQFQLASLIPGKADFARTIAYFEGELRRLNVQIRLGERIDADSIGQLEACQGVIVASGVIPRPLELPGATLPSVRSYAQAVLEASPNAARAGSVAIIGAGGVGVDVAHLYSRAGLSVTLMRRGEIIGEHIGRSTRWVLLRELREHGVQTLTGVGYERIVPEGVWIRLRDGAERLIEAQTVVVAIGQQSHDPLSAALRQRGVPFQVVGGAHLAAELDAVRAFREGAIAAHALGERAEAS